MTHEAQFLPPVSPYQVAKRRKTLLRNTLAMSQVPPDKMTLAAVVSLAVEIAKANGMAPIQLLDYMAKSIGATIQVVHHDSSDDIEDEEPEIKIGGVQ